MKYDEFIETVAARAGLPVEAAERLTDATLVTLAERLTAGEARDLAAQLPPPLQAPLIPPTQPAQPFGLDEFVVRVARRADVDEVQARHSVRAVFSTLADAVTGGEFDDVMSQLPSEFEDLLQQGARPGA